MMMRLQKGLVLGGIGAYSKHTFIAGDVGQSFEALLESWFKTNAGWYFDANRSNLYIHPQGTPATVDITVGLMIESNLKAVDKRADLLVAGSATQVAQSYINSDFSAKITRLDVNNTSYLRTVIDHQRLYKVNITIENTTTAGAVLSLRSNNGVAITGNVMSDVTTFARSVNESNDVHIQPNTNAVEYFLKINQFSRLDAQHAIQITTSKRPLLKQGLKSKYLQFDAIDDSLDLTNSALTNCTVIVATINGITVQTGQAIGANYQITQDFCAHFVINRLLTLEEQAVVVSKFNEYIG